MKVSGNVMASRIIHICIAEKLAKKFSLNYDKFLLGSIAPDAPSLYSTFSFTSHFALPSEKREGNKFIDYASFIDKYINSNSDDFFLGYYCHLICDNIWHSDIYTKCIINTNSNESQARMETAYKDYRRLNGKVIEFYALEDLKNISIKTIDNVEMEEINFKDIEDILKEAKKDFDYGTEVDGPLEILEFDMIQEYISKATLECSNVIKKHLENCACRV